MHFYINKTTELVNITTETMKLDGINKPEAKLIGCQNGFLVAKTPSYIIPDPISKKPQLTESQYYVIQIDMLMDDDFAIRGSGEIVLQFGNEEYADDDALSNLCSREAYLRENTT